MTDKEEALINRYNFAEYGCSDRECITIHGRGSFTRIQTSKGAAPSDQWAREFVYYLNAVKARAIREAKE